MKAKVFLNTAAGNLKSAKSISGERFINYDKTNDFYRVKIKVDGETYIDTARKTLAAAKELRDATIPAIVAKLTTEQPVKKVRKATDKTKLYKNLLAKLTGPMKRDTKSGTAFVFYDKYNNNYAVIISAAKEQLVYKRFATRKDAVAYRNKVKPQIISQLKHAVA